MVTHFITGTSGACTSVFKPIWVDACPNFGETPGDTAICKNYKRTQITKSGNSAYPSGNSPTAENSEIPSLWWRHEYFHRLIMADYKNRISLVSDERDKMEKEFVFHALKLANESENGNQKERIEFSKNVWNYQTRSYWSGLKKSRILQSKSVQLGITISIFVD